MIMKVFKLFKRAQSPKIKMEPLPDGSIRFVVPVGIISPVESKKSLDELLKSYKQDIKMPYNKDYFLGQKGGNINIDTLNGEKTE